MIEGVFVWVGKNASKQERAEAMRNGQGFAVKKDYSTKTNVTRVIDGGEPIEFRSLFKNWKVVDETTSVKVHVPCNVQLTMKS